MSDVLNHVYQAKGADFFVFFAAGFAMGAVVVLSMALFMRGAK